tara:strand:- start:200 stop:547 length:348 start_codon:yes stop_codon:yes gene_type:complete
MRTSVMLCEKCNLPNDIVNEIMSYTFPNVKEQHNSVVRQISYNYKEFNYLRNLPLNFYYRFYDNEFLYFIFNRIYDKQEVNNKNVVKDDEGFVQRRKHWGGYFDEDSGVNYIIYD